jgi:hypothetical protein
MVVEVDAAVCRGLQHMRPHDMCACALLYFNPHLSLAYSLACPFFTSQPAAMFGTLLLTLLTIFAPTLVFSGRFDA